jgi:hypothetical protein
MLCATHPTVETDLACSRCEKAICPRCLVHTPVGARCRECANVRRIPTYNVAGTTLWRAAGAALVGGAAIGLAWAFFNIVTYVFFGLLAGIAIGYALGEIVSLATNRKSGPPLQAIAVGGIAVAWTVRTLMLFVLGDFEVDDLRLDIQSLIAAGIACFIAAGRLR